VVIALWLPALPLLLVLVGPRAVAGQVFQPASRAAVPAAVPQRDLSGPTPPSASPPTAARPWARWSRPCCCRSWRSAGCCWWTRPASWSRRPCSRSCRRWPGRATTTGGARRRSWPTPGPACATCGASRSCGWSSVATWPWSPAPASTTWPWSSWPPTPSAPAGPRPRCCWPASPSAAPATCSPGWPGRAAAGPDHAAGRLRGRRGRRPAGHRRHRPGPAAGPELSACATGRAAPPGR
jgi:hypothetical protein